MVAQHRRGAVERPARERSRGGVSFFRGRGSDGGPDLARRAVLVLEEDDGVLALGGDPLRRLDRVGDRGFLLSIRYPRAVARGHLPQPASGRNVKLETWHVVASEGC